jgi:hypothetical protein
MSSVYIYISSQSCKALFETPCISFLRNEGQGPFQMKASLAYINISRLTTMPHTEIERYNKARMRNTYCARREKENICCFVRSERMNLIKATEVNFVTPGWWGGHEVGC